jgi:hypothetical protein
MFLTKNFFYAEMIFIQLINGIQLFSSGEKLPKVAERSQNKSKMDPLKWGVDR